jgi:hypothetical protein
MFQGVTMRESRKKPNTTHRLDQMTEREVPISLIIPMPAT